MISGNTPAAKSVASVRRNATVMDAVRAMVERNVSACIVLDEGRLVGIFTERDVVIRVVLERRDAMETQVVDVMTRSVVTVRDDADRTSALRLMNAKHIRHLPVVDAEGRVVMVLSMRHLMRAEVQDLQQTVWELVADTSIDGPGG
jgi:CBS domain-containing protein